MEAANNRRILLVDDTPAIHEDFRKLLGIAARPTELDAVEAALFGTPVKAARSGFELHSALQGEEACAAAAAALGEGRPFALAFVDMRMPPGIDGAQTIERLWQIDPRLQIVICTAYSDHAWESLLPRLMPGDRLLVLKKPFDPIEVRQLAEALTAKWNMTQRAQATIDELERAVQQRTAEIQYAYGRLRRLNRMIAVTSSINAAIVRIHERTELFDAACRIAISQGEFALAWVGWWNETGRLDAMAVHASTAIDDERLCEALLSAELPRGSLSQARPQVLVAQGEALRHGLAIASAGEGTLGSCRSLALVPLLLAGQPVAMMALYSREENSFDAEELSLLAELAEDLSFALDHIEKERRLNYLAYYDELTGLANRARFGERVQALLAQPVTAAAGRAVLLLDLRRFRHVNALGRGAGDALLREVAQRLTLAVGAAGVLARTNADCFAIALEHPVDRNALCGVIESLIHGCFARPFVVDEHEIRITPHVGVALSPADGADADTLFKNAEAALKRAKRLNETYVFYTPDLNARAADALTLENRLRAAIEEEAFILHYQPQIDARDGRLIGVEALVRWPTADMGMIMPGRFIAMAEDLGLIAELGRLVLWLACRQARAWLDAGQSGFSIAVNVSPIQLHRAGFLREVREALERSRLPPGVIELEITESAIMEDVERTQQLLQALRETGAKVALDDFGTGYSSLSRLKRLPIDKLKIDQSFVAEIAADADDAAIVRTIIAMAHQLQKSVVAEGVETVAQLRFLQANGCDECQGRLFGMPMPAADAERLLGLCWNGAWPALDKAGA